MGAESGRPASSAPGAADATSVGDSAPPARAGPFRVPFPFELLSVVTKAAETLGVSAAALSAETGPSEALGGYVCRYWSPESLIGPGIQFLVEAEPSAAAAVASLRSPRENAPSGDAVIRDAIGQPKTGPPLIEFEGLGEEAFWEALTTAVNLGVGNVVITIQASSSRQLSPDKERTDIALERRVAEHVARGLRSP